MQRAQRFAFPVALAASLVAAPCWAAEGLPPGGPGTDAAPALDPTRPVVGITRSGFTLQYYTPSPCPTRVQVRRGDSPVAAGRLRGDTADPWSDADVRVVDGPPGERTLHRVAIDGLEPGTRYLYRVHDPATDPTSEETRWGAAKPWRREYAVSTQAAPGQKTIVRYPVKVLLMPNVINVESATKDPAKPAPHPERVTDEQMRQVREELNRASRFLFVNSHMRLWVDFQVFVDDRWQRWGPEPEGEGGVDEFYRGWPICRSYAGEDYHPPGGGDFSILDTTEPLRANERRVREDKPFYGQAEIAFPRRWDPAKGAWVYYTSGGGTLGVDSVPSGIPARSQFFGGYDTAWLATHEIHHQLESLSAFSLEFREDERIVFNHWSPRSRSRGPDAASGPEGSKGVHPWTTSDRHGEHYDGMAFWDRTLSDAQWLRMFLTETVVVTDADGDGVPDDDARLPLDERRFGSDPAKAATDGAMNDLDKAMLSTWAPAPLQARFDKPAQTFARPNPTERDSDRDGWDDREDPYPLVPHEPFVWPIAATVDGDAAEWSGVPSAGVIEAGGLSVEFKQGHDDAGYFGMLRATGDWSRIRVVLDGEGKGMYSGEGVQAIRVLNGDEIRVDTKDRFFPGARGLTWAAKRGSDGTATIEFRFPNMGEGAWYWRGAGREVGSVVEVTGPELREWSMHEPYRPFYCRMLGRPGKDPMPGGSPGELGAGDGVVALKPGDDGLKTGGSGWKVEGGALRHSGPGEDAVYVDGLDASEFDLWARVEARSDAILGAFTPGTGMGAVNDYVAFVGGYANTKSRLRLFGSEEGDTGVVVTPGEHTMQLSRRGGVVWCLWDGKPVLWAIDPDPKKVVDRLAVLGGYGGAQVVHEVRYRVGGGGKTQSSKHQSSNE